MEYTFESDEIENKISFIEKMAGRMREQALKMAYSVGSIGSHIGGGLSMIEIMATLYGGILRFDPDNPEWDNRDRFILSKGHGVLAYYTALAEAGFFSTDELLKFEVSGEFLPGHPILNMEKGIECSTGSLGMGLPFGAGIALAGKMEKKPYLTYVLVGDGECDEGSIWEAAMFASHYHLSNLIVIVDHNKLQYDGPCCDVMNLDNFKAKWESFGWEVTEVDGHNIRDLYHAFSCCTQSAIVKPHVIIASTIKGKGVSFMENNKAWHHSVLSRKQYDQAIEEIRGANND
ncbi:transketolase [Methanogenium organophilum]|uniref:Transketolase n=1 Tax=Methanogenium organophilum TaxID=2199 RepID=A0A9X9S5C1_METOG|nr:transketolase [Methanogenium organophilum]WAI01205.1 transketolase [Methanogenium organophilum]